MYNNNNDNSNNDDLLIKQAGAELGQAQLKLGFGFTSVYLYQIDKLEI